MPQISVIVPVYKVERYLHRCVDSILAQTFRDFELILVDDGSPDNCGAICDEYAAKDDRIHVLHQKNGGLSAARNAGIEWASANSDSEWLSFIDSDDWVHPCFLEYLYRAVSESGSSVSACNYVRVEKQMQEYQTMPADFYIESWDRFYIEAWGRGVVAWCKLYAKNLFTGMRYPVGRINEDEFLTYRILDRAKNVAVLNADLYYYFQNPEGIIKSAFNLKKLDCVNALIEQRAFAYKDGKLDLYVECQRRILARCYEYIGLIGAEVSLTEKESEQAEQFMRHEMQKILLRDGKTIAPLREKTWYYETAFPNLAWLYWTSRGICEKLKRMINR